MTDMSDTFRARLDAFRAPSMVHVDGPKRGAVHPMGPYCERAGCVPEDQYTDEEDA